MTLLVWDSSYDIGLAAIDADHRQLAERINALDVAIAGNDDVVVRETLAQLTLFTEAHFGHEQALFRKTGYPAAALHSKRHDFLVLILRRFAETITSRRDLAAEELEFLRGWLLDHIGKDDRAFADYARDRFPALTA